MCEYVNQKKKKPKKAHERKGRGILLIITIYRREGGKKVNFSMYGTDKQKEMKEINCKPKKMVSEGSGYIGI